MYYIIYKKCWPPRKCNYVYHHSHRFMKSARRTSIQAISGQKLGLWLVNHLGQPIRGQYFGGKQLRYLPSVPFSKNGEFSILLSEPEICNTLIKVGHLLSNLCWICVGTRIRSTKFFLLQWFLNYLLHKIRRKFDTSILTQIRQYRWPTLMP